MTPRKRTAELLELSLASDRTGRLVDVFLIGLIVLSVLAVILESVESLERRYDAWFFGFEAFTVAVFSVEYLLRLWSCIDRPLVVDRHPVSGRIRYALTPLALIDLIAILPFFLGFFITVDLRFLRVVRLLRVLKIGRYSPAVSVLLEVVQEERHAFFAAIFVLAMMLIFAASGVYLLERQVQPDAFGSIPDAMWWAIATLTTVGYGDVVPVTVGGKLFAGMVSLIGIGMVALPAGILASGFADHLHRRREQFSEVVGDFLSDGVISQEERWQLEELRKELNLSSEESRELFDAMARKGLHLRHHCPHCGGSLRRESDPRPNAPDR